MLSIIRQLAAQREQSAGEDATGLPRRVQLVWTVRHKSEFTILDQAVLAAATWVVTDSDPRARLCAHLACSRTCPSCMAPAVAARLRATLEAGSMARAVLSESKDTDAAGCTSHNASRKPWNVLKLVYVLQGRRRVAYHRPALHRPAPAGGNLHTARQVRVNTRKPVVPKLFVRSLNESAHL
jgi:hypothetical protein